MSKPDALTEHVWAERADERGKTAARIAAKIRAELVCCDIYDRLSPVLAAAARSGWAEVTDTNTNGHAICYWGEAAARIADGEATR